MMHGFDARIRCTPRCGVVCRLLGDGVAIAVVETLDRSGIVQRLLDAADAELGPDVSPADWPERLATALDARFRAAAARRELATPGPFAAAALTGAEVHVTTLGTVRVHLLDGGTVIASSRDHILRTEPGDADPRTVERRGTSPTRAVGGPRFAPDSMSWAAPATPTILILTEDYHGFDAPEVYAADPWSRPSPDGNGPGAIAMATRIPDADRWSGPRA
jgi:hypothetical protein